MGGCGVYDKQIPDDARAPCGCAKDRFGILFHHGGGAEKWACDGVMLCPGVICGLLRDSVFIDVFIINKKQEASVKIRLRKLSLGLAWIDKLVYI